MSRSNLITALDIGSSTIRVAVGQFVGKGNREQPHIIAALETASDGISRGVIRSIDDAVSRVSLALERAEKITGVELRSVYLGVSGVQMLSMESKGFVAVSRSDGEITEADVECSIEAARTFATPSNYDILHVVPRSFTVDNEKNIKDPIGMHGIRLEVSAYIIQALSSQIKNLTKCVYRVGVEIDDLVLSSLAAADSVLTNRAKELGTVLLSIGASHTSIVVYEGGELIYTGIVPIGGEHITSDIAIGLRTSFDVAEELKNRYGTALSKDISKKLEVNLRELGAPDDEIVSLKMVSEIIEARVDEIFGVVDQVLRRLGKSGKLPAGAMLVGGTAKLGSIVEASKKLLGLPTSIGYPLGVTSVSDKVSDPSFASVIGLLKWGSESSKSSGSSLQGLFESNILSKSIGRQIKWLSGLFGR